MVKLQRTLRLIDQKMKQRFILPQHELKAKPHRYLLPTQLEHVLVMYILTLRKLKVGSHKNFEMLKSTMYLKTQELKIGSIRELKQNQVKVFSSKYSGPNMTTCKGPSINDVGTFSRFYDPSPFKETSFMNGPLSM